MSEMLYLKPGDVVRVRDGLAEDMYSYYQPGDHVILKHQINHTRMWEGVCMRLPGQKVTVNPVARFWEIVR